MLLVGEDAPHDELHGLFPAFQLPGGGHVGGVEDVPVVVVEAGRVEDELVDLRELRIFDVLHLEVADHGLHAPDHVPGQLQTELAGVEGVPVLLVRGGEAVFGGPELIPRGDAVGQGVAAENGVGSVVDGAEGGDVVVPVPHALAAGGKEDDHGVEKVHPVLGAVLGGKELARIFPPDEFHHLPESADAVAPAAGGVLVGRVVAVGPRGAADHVQIDAGESRIAELFHQIGHLALEYRRFAAHVAQPVVVVAVEGHGVFGAVPPDLDLLRAPFVETGAVHVPRAAVDVDLRVDPLIVHALHGLSEGLFALPGGPEVGIVRVVGIVVPPVPVQRDGDARLLRQTLHRGEDVVDPAPVPQPHGNVLQGIFLFRGVGVPPLTPGPRTVDPRRFEPVALELGDGAGIGDGIPRPAVQGAVVDVGKEQFPALPVPFVAFVVTLRVPAVEVESFPAEEGRREAEGPVASGDEFLFPPFGRKVDDPPLTVGGEEFRLFVEGHRGAGKVPSWRPPCASSQSQ